MKKNSPTQELRKHVMSTLFYEIEHENLAGAATVKVLHKAQKVTKDDVNKKLL